MFELASSVNGVALDEFQRFSVALIICGFKASLCFLFLFRCCKESVDDAKRCCDVVFFHWMTLVNSDWFEINLFCFWFFFCFDLHIG